MAVEAAAEAVDEREDAAEVYDQYCCFASRTSFSRGPEGATTPCSSKKSRSLLSSQLLIVR